MAVTAALALESEFAVFVESAVLGGDFAVAAVDVVVAAVVAAATKVPAAVTVAAGGVVLLEVAAVDDATAWGAWSATRSLLG